MEGKLKTIKDELKRQIKIISISSTIIVNLLYISYLTFALRHSIGNRYVNFTLALATGAFLLMYLIFQTFGENKKNVKRTKKVYKRIKRITKIFTVFTAIYTVATAVGSVSPIAAIFAIINAVILGIQMIFDLIASIIVRGARRVKTAAVEKHRNKKKAYPHEDFSLVTSPDDVVKITEDDL